MLGIGAILFVASNWSGIPDFLKILITNKNITNVQNISNNNNNIAIHFRGSDFCITNENFNFMNNYKFIYFTLNFIYYYESIIEILKNMSEQYINIDIFHNASDNDIVILMKIYLQTKLESMFTNKIITIRNESEIMRNLDIVSEIDVINIMSKYKNIVLSNSTFCFWSAILSSKETNIYYIYGEFEMFNNSRIIQYNVNYSNVYEKLNKIIQNNISRYLKLDIF